MDDFEQHRGLIFAVAYRMLGSVADAEDVVQDAWLRWSAGDRTEVADPKAYLVRIATNTAIDRLRSDRAKRESYIGPWLPEPLQTTQDAADLVELTESVSMAMLVVLETLTPLERAVFVLREVFGFAHSEIAGILDRSEASVRQVSHRAREHVATRRPRFDTDRAEQRRVAEEFISAAAGGDLDRLLAVLAPDVTLISDGGGKRQAALRPLYGESSVARWLAAIATRTYEGVDRADMEIRPAELNGAPGWIIYGGGMVLSTLSIDIVDGLVHTIHVVANPDKLEKLPPP
jgi:RNA polymerase sigma-70 factor (TIGR02957 family)